MLPGFKRQTSWYPASHPGIYTPLLPVMKLRTSDFQEFDYSGETRVHCLKLERRIIQLPLAEVSQVNFAFKGQI